MSNQISGEFLYPRHCRVGVSPDKSQLAFTFSSDDRAPLTVVLPLLGAAGFQRNLAQCLYLLGVRPVVTKDAPAATEPQPAPETVALDQA
jgi:hypothetical protein